MLGLPKVHCGGCHLVAHFGRVAVDSQVKSSITVRRGLAAHLANQICHRRMGSNLIKVEDFSQLDQFYIYPRIILKIRHSGQMYHHCGANLLCPFLCALFPKIWVSLTALLLPTFYSALIVTDRNFIFASLLTV